jgi:hypothetical protein
VHAQHAVAGIEEALDEIERHAVRVGEPFHGRAGFAANGFDLLRIGLALVLGEDVARHQRRRIGDALGALKARIAGHDHARRHGRRALRRRIALEHKHFGAHLLGHQRGDEPARAGADNGDVRFRGEAGAGGRQDAHALVWQAWPG